MGNYLNPGNEKFRRMIQSEIYVDKTGMIKYTNSVLDTAQNYVCVSRPRRFGKSMAANMLTAYYSRGCNSKELFGKFEIAKDKDFEKYLNQYNTIFLNMQEFLSRSHNVEELIDRVKKLVIRDLKMEYPEVDYFDDTDLIECMQDIYAQMQYPFVVIIDEWDVLIRDEASNQKIQDDYINFLRGMFKGTEPTKYIQLAFLTGILPIKKLKTQSALNNFHQYSMLNPGPLASYIGFTEDEVSALCQKYGQNFEEVRRWYDGYLLGNYHVYNPNAVTSLLLDGTFQSYWSETSTYDSMVPFINMDFDGLKTAILEMLSGAAVPVLVTSFKNDMVSVVNKDDVLTLLIHLGYLAYNQQTQMAYIPNEEIRREFLTAVTSNRWNELLTFQQESAELLDATLAMDENAVAAGIGKIHEEYTSVIQYHNENSLSCVLTIAYLSSIQYYFKPIRELPTGRGFSDFVFLPKPEYRYDFPALVVELKWNKNAETALDQIKRQHYPASIASYTGDILLVGVNYDKKTKVHECRIEKYLKSGEK